jgi:hypothetical protein
MRSAGTRVLGDSQTTIRNGNWFGNDTCWRMVLDLNRALLYGNPDGSWRESGSKPYVGIVEGIVGGEGNGPLGPDPVESRVMLAGSDPAAIDLVACRLMGFEPRAVPLIERAFDSHRWRIAANGLDEVMVMDRAAGEVVPSHEPRATTPGGFQPHFGWASLAELANAKNARSA